MKCYVWKNFLDYLNIKGKFNGIVPVVTFGYAWCQLEWKQHWLLECVQLLFDILRGSVQPDRNVGITENSPWAW